MTDLTRRVARRTDVGERRPVVVTLYPNATIGFREKGRRTEFVLPLATVYRYAAAKAAEAIRAERAARRKARRTGR